MKKKLLLVLSAAMVMLSFGATVSADTVVFDAVDIIDVQDDGLLIGLPDGAQVLVTYDLLTAAMLPREVEDIYPPDPCTPIVKRWNKVISQDKPESWRTKQAVHLLRRMGAKGCRVLIEYEDVQPEPPIRDATAIQPDAL